MDIMNRLIMAGIVPVVVIDDAKDAVPVAEAMLAGGINVMEITFRTAAAPDAIKAVVDNCPDMLVGAGTVITLEQCKKAVEMGAKFIVSPGFDAEVVKWCVDNGVAITPGCVTPSEIMAAMKLGLNVVKFFPANVYGGLSAMKALSGPFCGTSSFLLAASTPRTWASTSPPPSFTLWAAAGSVLRPISLPAISRRLRPCAPSPAGIC